MTLKKTEILDRLYRNAQITLEELIEIGREDTPVIISHPQAPWPNGINGPTWVYPYHLYDPNTVLTYSSGVPPTLTIGTGISTASAGGYNTPTVSAYSTFCKN